MKTYIYTKTHTGMSIALFIITKRWKQPKCLSTEEWINKMCYIHMMEYYSAIKSNEGLIHATTWMDLDNILLTERSHKLYDSIYMKYPEQA